MLFRQLINFTLKTTLGDQCVVPPKITYLDLWLNASSQLYDRFHSQSHFQSPSKVRSCDQLQLTNV